MRGKGPINTHCLYCGNPMAAKTRGKKFCSDKCRVYNSRENNYENTGILRQPVVQKTSPVVVKRKNLNEQEIAEIRDRIDELQYELNHPPAFITVGLTLWTSVRVKMIRDLKAQLPPEKKAEIEQEEKMYEPEHIFPVTKIKTPLQYIEEKRELLSAEGHNEWLAELEADPHLSKKQKELIKNT